MGKIKHLRHTKKIPKRRKDGVSQRYWTGKKKGKVRGHPRGEVKGKTIISMRMPKTKSEAQDRAMEYQRIQAMDSMSWGEVAEYQHFFERVAKKFNLTEEFKENGII